MEQTEERQEALEPEQGKPAQSQPEAPLEQALEPDRPSAATIEPPTGEAPASNGVESTPVESPAHNGVEAHGGAPASTGAPLATRPASGTTRTPTPARARERKRASALLRATWKWRVLVAGLPAIALAILGEWLMRAAPPFPAPNPRLGSVLLWVAVLLVGPVAWVRDDFNPVRFVRSFPSRIRSFSGLRSAKEHAEESATAEGQIAYEEASGKAAPLPERRPATRGFLPYERAGAEVSGGHAPSTISPTRAPVTTLGTRAVRSQAVRAGESAKQARPRPTIGMLWHRFANRYTDLRTRAGWWGTALGLAVTGGLAIWLGVLLFVQKDFGSPTAGWVWFAMLVALVLTFTGVRPWPRGATLLPHDPAEPAEEPIISRTEWIILGIIMLATVLLRVWNLDQIPVGPYTDEGDRAIDARHLNRGEPVNRTTFLFFGTGWWGVPNFYFWLLAQSLKLFGDNLTGARMIHAIAGILTVWFVYRVARSVWSPRAGLIAAALAAVSDFAIQFSRTAGESTITLFTWTACFYFLYRGLKTRRPLDFVMSGIAGGFTLLGYASGKLLPFFLVGAGIYILLRWGFLGMRRYFPGLLLVGVAAALTCGPNLLYVETQNPAALTERSSGVYILTQANPSDPTSTYAYQQYHTNSWLGVLPPQFALTYAAFDVGSEKGPFYPTDQPILPIVWAAFWILGTAYMVWRIGDTRYALLAAWLLAGLAGPAFTNDTPTLQRSVGMVPTLALIPAFFIDRVASGLAPPFRLRVALPRRRQVVRWATNGVIGLVVILLGVQTTTYYFGPYNDKALYYWYTLAGRYAEKLDYTKDTIYQLDIPEFFWGLGPALFLADRVQGRDIGNASEDLPLTDNHDKTAHFLVFPSNAAYMPILQSYYPGGTQSVVNRPDGSTFMTVYKVTSQQIEERRQVTARYGPPQGPLFERQEPRIGTLTSPDDSGTEPETVRPPDWITYPTRVQWLGGLVAPAYGTYRLSLDAPAGGFLQIDGRQVLTMTQGSQTPGETALVLAKGVHKIELTGTLNSPDAKVDLRWGAVNGALVPIPRRYLWGGPLGTFVGESYPTVNDPSWFRDPHPNLQGTLPSTARRDGLLGWHSINQTLNGGTGVFGIWHGRLSIPTAGSYQFNAQGTGRITILVDGSFVASSGMEGTTTSSGTPMALPPMPGQVNLPAGEHDIDVRFQATQDNATLELYWTPPNGTQQVLLPPDALVPIDGGVWTTDERPNVSSPDPSLLGAATVQKLSVVRTIDAPGTWAQARGVGVTPDGKVMVADTGNRRLVLYGPDGKQISAAKNGAGGDKDTFNLLSDIAVSDDGLLGVLDAENGDIRLFDANGQEIKHLSHDAVGVTHASGIAFAPDGSIYVADTGASRIVKLNRDGQVQATMREGLNGIQPLEQPTDVVVMSDGTVYAVDLSNRLVRFNAAGMIDRQWTVTTTPDNGGNHLARWGNLIAMTVPGANTITFIDPDKGLAHTPDIVGNTQLNLLTPVGVCTGFDGRLYVLDSGNNRVVVLQSAS